MVEILWTSYDIGKRSRTGVRRLFRPRSRVGRHLRRRELPTRAPFPERHDRRTFKVMLAKAMESFVCENKEDWQCRPQGA